MPYFGIEKAPASKHLRWNVSCPEGYRHYTVAEMAQDGTQLPGGFTEKDGTIFHKGYYLWAKDLVMAAPTPELPIEEQPTADLAPEPEPDPAPEPSKEGLDAPEPESAPAPTGKVAAAKKRV